MVSSHPALNYQIGIWKPTSLVFAQLEPLWSSYTLPPAWSLDIQAYPSRRIHDHYRLSSKYFPIRAASNKLNAGSDMLFKLLLILCPPVNLQKNGEHLSTCTLKQQPRVRNNF